MSYSPNWIIRGTWPHNMRGEDGEAVLNISIICTAKLMIFFLTSERGPLCLSRAVMVAVDPVPLPFEVAAMAVRYGVS